MSLWIILQPLLLLIVALFFILQVVVPIVKGGSIFPLLRKRQGASRMVAEQALELAEEHISEAMRLTSFAETNAETETEDARARLEHAKQVLAEVKKQSRNLNKVKKRKEG
ncbi:hypothetical protein MYX06_02850 [Patescibacteria group bacterium AH-259-L05]|nr:hypothetical protein [Patescibacteria group bacterium AH-259-L05]